MLVFIQASAVVTPKRLTAAQRGVGEWIPIIIPK